MYFCKVSFASSEGSVSLPVRCLVLFSPLLLLAQIKALSHLPTTTKADLSPSRHSVWVIVRQAAQTPARLPQRSHSLLLGGRRPPSSIPSDPRAVPSRAPAAGTGSHSQVMQGYLPCPERSAGP